jgi:hypothetical protein
MHEGSLTHTETSTVHTLSGFGLKPRFSEYIRQNNELRTAKSDICRDSLLAGFELPCVQLYRRTCQNQNQKAPQSPDRTAALYDPMQAWMTETEGCHFTA